MRLSFREAIGIKIATATLRDVLRRARQGCVEVDRVLWILDELDRIADRIVRDWVASRAMSIGAYLGEELLEAKPLATVTRS